MDLSFIIVNYNTTALTVACIRSIYEFTKSNTFEIIVVDNASSDTSIQQICNLYPEVQLVVNSENIGFGRANNQAIAITEGKYIFLLNSDTLLTSDAAHVFFNYMECVSNSDVACCGGELIKPDGKPQISYGNFPSIAEAFASLGFLIFFKRYFQHHLSSGVVNYANETRLVDYICGADLFIRKLAIEKVGAFDPAFFLYYEETELCLRFKQAGLKVVLLPEIKIIHYEGASYGDAEFNYHRTAVYAKSRMLYFKKAYGTLSSLLINKIYGLQALIFFVLKRKRGYILVAKIFFSS